MVKITLNNINSKIIGVLPDDVQALIDQELSYKLKEARYMKCVKNKKWDGVVHLFNRNYQSFSSGMASSVTDILDANNVEYVKVDERRRPEQNLPNLVFTPPKFYEARDYQQFTIERAHARTRGILKMATGSGKCLGKGTPILMYDGSIKKVEDVIVGDLLMGPDSKPRTVKSTNTGYGELYLIEQNNGNNFICNDEHILCLQTTSSPSRNMKAGKEVQITASDYYKSSKTFKHRRKGYKVGVEFEKRYLPIDPYFLGLWLGDGNSKEPAITTGDKEIVEYINRYALNNGFSIREAKGKGCKTYYLTEHPQCKDRTKCSHVGCEASSSVGGMCEIHYFRKYRKGFRAGKHTNKLLNLLREIGVTDNKHIPLNYKINGRKSRLSLLAGLIDSDGTCCNLGTVEFYNTNKRLAEDVCWLARSLGFLVSLKTKKDSIKKTGYKGISYRVRIGGKISDIPILIKRKQAGDKTKYSSLRYGISAKPIGKGNYFGFEIDGDRKFLLEDFTVTHNTMVACELIAKIKTAPFMFYVLSTDLMKQAHDNLSSVLNEKIGMIGGGNWDIRNINVCTIQSAIRAINIDKKIKVSDYRFDEDDSWDEKDVLSMEKLQSLRNLIIGSKGLALDECHHVGCKTAREILNASLNAYWRYGFSATPYREDGAEILIQAVFGRKIVDISASYLIDHGFLIEPYVIFDPIVHENCSLHSYQSIYKTCIEDNEAFNRHVAKTANHLVSRQMSTLVLVKHYPQGNMLKDFIPGSDFITGEMAVNKRSAALDDLRARRRMCLIATSLADEGLDVPTLDAALLAGGGASSTRVHQRIGRTLRIDRTAEHPRDKSIVVYYSHKGAKYLDKHASKARKIIKTEPRFRIIDSAGGDYVNSEIDSIMGFDSGEKSIFEV